MALTKIKTGSVSDSITLTTPDINGGTIDGTVVGGTTPAAISGTTGQFGTSLNVDGTATVDGLTVDHGLIKATHTGGLGAFADFEQFAGWDRRLRVTSAAAGIGIDVTNIALSSGRNLILQETGGNVGIGTDAPLRQVGIESTANAEISMVSGTSNVCSILMGDGKTGADYYRGYIQYNNSNDSMLMATSSATRMTIDASGTTSFNGIGGRATGSTGHMSISEQSNNRSYVELATTTPNSTSLLGLINPNGNVGSIATSGSATSFNTSSDYRLKENVVPMTGSIDRVKALKPSRFNFIVDSDTTVDGFLAHEAQEVVPECVTGTKDAMMEEEYEVTAAVEEVRDEDDNVTTEAAEAVTGTRSVPDMQGIDQSKLVPLLVAALQEAIARIEILEGA
jgi:hypothetical protein